MVNRFVTFNASKRLNHPLRRRSIKKRRIGLHPCLYATLSDPSAIHQTDWKRLPDLPKLSGYRSTVRDIPGIHRVLRSLSGFYFHFKTSESTGYNIIYQSEEKGSTRPERSEQHGAENRQHRHRDDSDSGIPPGYRHRDERRKEREHHTPEQPDEKPDSARDRTADLHRGPQTDPCHFPSLHHLAPSKGSPNYALHNLGCLSESCPRFPIHG